MFGHHEPSSTTFLVRSHRWITLDRCQQVRFMVDGERIAADDTAEKLGLEALRRGGCGVCYAHGFVHKSCTSIYSWLVTFAMVIIWGCSGLSKSGGTFLPSRQ